MYSDGVPSLDQLLFENEKNRRKLRKVQQRRDHYAKLYFETLSELDDTKCKLERATNAIRKLKSQGQRLHLQRDMREYIITIYQQSLL